MAVPTHLHTELSRALRFVALKGNGHALPKSQKPDFEAAFFSPAHERIFVLGSGSGKERRWVMHLPCIDYKIDAIESFQTIDAGPMFDALEQALGTIPNIEGAVLIGPDRARLFHRGSGGGQYGSAYLDISVEALFSAAPSPPKAQLCALGNIGGVELSFTDACEIGEGRVLYLAAAEDTPDAVADGPVLGAALGVMDSDGLRFALLSNEDGSPFTAKVEGIAADADARFAYLISDPDDASVAAELVRVALSGPWIR